MAASTATSSPPVAAWRGGVARSSPLVATAATAPATASAAIAGTAKRARRRRAGPDAAMPGPGRQLQIRLVAQHGLLQPAQVRARLEPELVDQRPPRVGVGLERLGLPAAAVQREHQLRAEPLPQRVARDQRAQLRDQLGVTTEREVGVDAQLERLEPLLLERLDGGDGELLVGEVGERAAPPLAERCAQRPGGLPRAAGRQVVAALRAQRLEARDVGAPRGRAHAIAGRDGLDDGVRLEQPAQARDVLLQRGARVGGRVVAPQLVDQRVRRHDLAGPQQEQREHAALAHAAQMERPAVVADLERAEEKEVETALHAATLPGRAALSAARKRAALCFERPRLLLAGPKEVFFGGGLDAYACRAFAEL